MANLKSAIKRVRTAERKTNINKAQRSKMRTALKKAHIAVEENAEDAEETVKSAVKILDRAATKGLISKEKAARHKSQLAKGLNSNKA